MFLKEIDKKKLIKIFFLVILINITLKVILSQISFGPYAIDDFNHNVIPAYALSKGINIDIPQYRSPLFVYIISWIFKLGEISGINKKIDHLKFLSFFLGTFFLLSNIGLYYYLKTTIYDNFRLKAFIFILYNLHFYLVFISTKAFGEFFSIIFLLNGLGFIEYGYKFRKTIWFHLGIFFVGLSVFFRYQNGIFYIVYMLYFFIFREKRYVYNFLLIGIILIFLQGIIDFLYHRVPLSTLYNYLVVNQNVSEVYGKTGNFSYLFLFMGFTLFPFSLLLFKSKLKILNLIRTHGIVFSLFIVFFTIHSIISHQEERFIAPLLPLFLILFANLWFYHRNNLFIKKIYNYFFLIIHSFLLILVLFSSTQAGLYLPVAKMAEKFDNLHIFYRNATLEKNWFLIHFFTFQKDIIFENINEQKHSLSDLANTSSKKYIMFLTNSQEIKLIWDLEKNTISYYCSDWQLDYSIVDLVLYKLNPKINEKRAPAYYFYCMKNELISLQNNSK